MDFQTMNFSIPQYVKQSVCEIIEGLQDYSSKDWKKFPDTLHQLFNHVKMEKCFKEKDLSRFVSKSQQGHIQSFINIRKFGIRRLLHYFKDLGDI